MPIWPALLDQFQCSPSLLPDLEQGRGAENNSRHVLLPIELCACAEVRTSHTGLKNLPCARRASFVQVFLAMAAAGASARSSSVSGAAQRAQRVSLRNDRNVQRLLVDPAEAEATIFFLHDALTHLHQWDAQLMHFRRKRSFRVVAYDAMGCGASDKPQAKDAYTENELVEDFLELWRMHFMEGKVNIIVGHGYGSVVAVRYVGFSRKITAQASSSFGLWSTYLPHFDTGVNVIHSSQSCMSG